MNRKIYLLAVVFCGLGLWGEASANTPSQTLVQKPIQFYVGMAGGVERMSGRRSESLNEDDGLGNRVLSVYTDNRKMLENNPSLSTMAGFLWKLPSLPIMMGPEVFLGRGTTLSSVKDTRLDTIPETRFYMTDFQRKTFYGALVRVGYQFCTDYLTYLSVGFDRGQFSIARTLTNNQGGRVPTTGTQYTNWFNGFLFGLGVEKKMASFKVGIDLRLVRYRKKNFVDNINVDPATGPGFLSFSVRPIIYTGTLRISYLF